MLGAPGFATDVNPEARYDTRPPRAQRKKSGFSKFVNNVLGSPRPNISSPTQPVHLTHVDYDNVTGQFIVCGVLVCNYHYH